ncbi:hypothetical protein BH09ACT10_BH09ACT10_15120 [soil metagenome]
MTAQSTLMVRPLPRATTRYPTSAPDQWSLPLGPTVPVSRELDAGALQERAAHFVRAVVEVLSGDRPLNQLASWVTGEVYDQLIDQVGRAAGPRRKRPREHVASVHLSMVNPAGAEVTARIVRQGRSRAAAIRLDLFTDLRGKQHWRCTALVWI